MEARPHLDPASRGAPLPLGAGIPSPLVQRPLSTRPLPASLRRVVVKVGTNLLTAGTDRLSLPAMAGLVHQLAELHGRGFEVLLVSSGAVAAGAKRLGEPGRGRSVAHRQELAAIGQSMLMRRYEELFSWYDIVLAQTLLTRADIADRLRYLNARSTLLGLLERRVLPIANENDVVSFEELEERFGDNDNLSALVATLVDADLLIMLSDIGGLYTADPNLDPEAEIIPHVAAIDATIEALAGGSASARGTGGMVTKLQAARLATASGIGVVLADGREPHVLARILGGEVVGTYFAPTAGRLEGRKRWLLGGASRRGTVYVDAGAATALRAQGRSLLPAGVVRVEGRFERGDTVDITLCDGPCLARGVANYSAAEIEAIRGHRSDKIAALLGYDYGAEVVHRNNLVML